MPDRILRADLLTSEPWLALKNNDDRVCWIALLLNADTLGNQPAGPHRLVHMWRHAGIDTPEKAAKVLSELTDVGLAIPYQNDCKSYVNIPRFRQSRRFLGRLNPLPDWASESDKQAFAKKSQVNHQRPQVNHQSALEGVGVGVGVGVGEDQERMSSAARTTPPPPELENQKRKAPQKGTRLPPDWKPTEEQLDFAASMLPSLPRPQLIREAMIFRDYWTAKAGKDATKLDWQATWRNWIRRKQDDGRNR